MKKHTHIPLLALLCLLLTAAPLPPAHAAGGRAASDVTLTVRGGETLNIGESRTVIATTGVGTAGITFHWTFSGPCTHSSAGSSDSEVTITATDAGPIAVSVAVSGAVTGSIGTQLIAKGPIKSLDMEHADSLTSRYWYPCTGTITLNKGGTECFRIAPLPEKGFCYYGNIKWTVIEGDPGVIGLDRTNTEEVTVTGKKKGTVKLQVSLEDQYPDSSAIKQKTWTAQCTITVDSSIDSINVMPNPGYIDRGGTLEFTASVSPEDPDVSYSWESNCSWLEVLPSTRGNKGVFKCSDSAAYGSSGTIRVYADNAHRDVTVYVKSPNPTSLTVSPDSCEMLQGFSANLFNGSPFTIDVEPDGASKEVTYSAAGAVSVNPNSGVVTANTADAAGTITVASTKASLTDDVTVNVHKFELQSGEETFSANGKQLELTLGDSSLTVTVTAAADVLGVSDVVWKCGATQLGKGKTLTIDGATLKAGNTKVPFSGTDGDHKTGDSATITATSGSRSISFTVKLVAVPVESITLKDFSLDKKINPSRDLNDKTDPVATILPGTASNKTLDWTASNPEILKIENGVATGLKVGTTALTAKATDGSGVVASCVVTVTDNAIPPESLILDPASIASMDKETPITAVIKPDNTTVKRVIWKSSDEKVVKIGGTTEDGSDLTVNLIPVAPGSAVITATTVSNAAGGAPLTATCEVTVSGIVITHKGDKGQELTGNVTIGVGDTMKLDKKTLGGAVDLTVGDWVWNSDNACVRVDATTGVIYGVSTGVANVTCRHGAVKATVQVTVAEENANNIIRRTMSGKTYSLGGVLTGALPTVHSLSQNVCGSALDYITNLTISADQGTLYYGYHSEADTGAGISGSDKFYAAAQGSLKLIDRITFVPRDGFTGVAKITFVGMSKSGEPEAYNGEIHITVPAAKDITYISENGEAIHFHSGDFTDYIKPVYGYPIASVRFPTAPSERYGYLYYDYPGGAVYASNVVNTRRYYSASKPALDSVSFVPREGYTGTFTIPYNGWDAAGNTFTGNITITVKRSDGVAGTGDIAYAAHSGQRLYFDAGDFVDLCKSATGGVLSYVQFTTLPEPAQAVMYAGTNGTTPLSASGRYYNTASGSARLMDVNILPAASFTGTLTVPFTGVDTAGKSFTGSVVVTVTTSTGAAEEIYKTSGGMPVTFSRSDFTSACKKALPAALKTVQFHLPSASSGKLYASFKDLHDNKPLSDGQELSAQALTNLVFVPKGSYSGSVYLSYTGTDEKGNVCAGSARVAVWPADTSEYFNDVKNVPWAVSSIDFLRRYGVVTGTTETTFAPLQPMGRGDFILMLSRAYDLPEAGRSSFYDVPQDSYYAEALASAKHEGIAGGDTNGNFSPTKSVTRQDAAVFLYRAMQNAEVISGGSSADLSRFPDGGDVALYAQEAMGTLTSMGIFIGDGQGLLNPASTLTRAEMAVILHRAIT